MFLKEQHNMKAIDQYLPLECYVFWFAFLDALRSHSQKTIESYNDLISDAQDRCRSGEPVSGEILDGYEFISLLRDSASALILPRLSDEALDFLIARCSEAKGVFSIHEKLAEAMQALKDGSGNDEFAGDARAKTGELLSFLCGLNELQRYALCDMLRLMDAVAGLTIDGLRARVGERACGEMGRVSNI